MTSQNPDPDSTAGLEPGGGVAPGDTPPAASEGVGPTHEPPQRGLGMPIVMLGILGVVVLIVVIGIVGRMAGLV